VKLSRAELSTDYADWSLVSSGSGVISSSSSSSSVIVTESDITSSAASAEHGHYLFRPNRQ